MIISFMSVDGDWVQTDAEHLTAAQEEEMLALARPETRPSLVEAFLQLDARQRRWLAQATEEQRAIGWGGYVTVRWEGTGSPLEPPPCTMYGALMTRRQFVAAEHAALVNLGGAGTATLAFEGGGEIALPVRPVEESVADMDAAYKNGWRYGRFWSVLEPVDGEPGEHHIANMRPITAKQFRRARLAGWPEEVPQP